MHDMCQSEVLRPREVKLLYEWKYGDVVFFHAPNESKFDKQKNWKGKQTKQSRTQENRR